MAGAAAFLTAAGAAATFLPLGACRGERGTGRAPQAAEHAIGRLPGGWVPYGPSAWSRLMFE